MKRGEAMVTLRGVVARGEKAETEVDSLQSETKSEKAATNTDRFMMIELWQDFGCRVLGQGEESMYL